MQAEVCVQRRSDVFDTQRLAVVIAVFVKMGAHLFRIAPLLKSFVEVPGRYQFQCVGRRVLGKKPMLLN